MDRADYWQTRFAALGGGSAHSHLQSLAAEIVGDDRARRTKIEFRRKEGDHPFIIRMEIPGETVLTIEGSGQHLLGAAGDLLNRLEEWTRPSARPTGS